MNISRFRRNGYEVFDAVPLCVTSRGKPLLNVRIYAGDVDIKQLPWSVVCQRSAADWRKFFETQDAQVVTLDGSPSFVVERWSDENL